MQTKHTIDMTKNHMNTTEPGEYAKGKQINYLKFVPRIQKTHSIAFMFFLFFVLRNLQIHVVRNIKARKIFQKNVPISNFLISFLGFLYKMCSHWMHSAN